MRTSQTNATHPPELHSSLLPKSADEDSGHCVWYDTCEYAECTLKYNFLYDGMAKPLPNQHDVDALRQVCPELVSEFGKRSLYRIRFLQVFNS